MVQCFLSVTSFGLRNGGGVGDVMEYEQLGVCVCVCVWVCVGVGV
jgi:hypothetical protein